MGKQSVKFTWNDGPPPSIGWWPASYDEDSDCLRWWDGTYWSVAAYKDTLVDDIAWCAEQKAGLQWHIQWKHRPHDWPKRSKT